MSGLWTVFCKRPCCSLLSPQPQAPPGPGQCSVNAGPLHPQMFAGQIGKGKIQQRGSRGGEFVCPEAGLGGQTLFSLPCRSEHELADSRTPGQEEGPALPCPLPSRGSIRTLLQSKPSSQACGFREGRKKSLCLTPASSSGLTGLGGAWVSLVVKTASLVLLRWG